MSEKHDGVSYDVVHASKWNEAFDGGRVCVPVSLTMLDRRIGYFLHLVRDTGVTVIGRRGTENVIVLEAGEDWLEFTLARIGTDRENFHKVLVNGAMGGLLGGDARAIKRRFKRKLSGAEEEIRAERREREELSRKLVRTERQAEKDRASAFEARAALTPLEQEILSLRKQLDKKDERIQNLIKRQVNSI